MLAWYDRSWCGKRVVQAWFVGSSCRCARRASVVRPPVVRCARCAARDRVQGVIPTEARRAARDPVQRVVPTARPSCRRDPVRVWFQPTLVVPRGSVLRWGAYAEQASDGGHPAEPIVAADRCAREIGAFLTHVLRRARGG